MTRRRRRCGKALLPPHLKEVKGNKTKRQSNQVLPWSVEWPRSSTLQMYWRTEFICKWCKVQQLTVVNPLSREQERQLLILKWLMKMNSVIRVQDKHQAFVRDLIKINIKTKMAVGCDIKFRDRHNKLIKSDCNCIQAMEGIWMTLNNWEGRTRLLKKVYKSSKTPNSRN